MAINLKTRGLRWSTNLPVSSGGLSAIVGATRLLVYTSRGVYEIDKANGDTKGIFRGDDLSAKGGLMTLVGSQLITVSNKSVSAYKKTDFLTDTP